jgi:hypothetical protein
MPTARWNLGSLVCAALLLAVLPAAACASNQFPYTAYVAVESAEVVSGPGHRHYATQHLPHGTAVDVYREEPSGWLAIRPPEGSFSWVPAEAVERTGDREVGRVMKPTGAWMGTAAERVSEHRQQVTLKEGELVHIQGEKTVTSGDEEQEWLKIAPPAGEFRWIHLRDVSRQQPKPRVAAAVEAEADAEEPADLPSANRSRRLLKDLRELRTALSDLERSTDGQEVLAGDRVEPDSFLPAEGAIALSDLEPAKARPIEQTIRSQRLHRDEIETVQFRDNRGSQPRPSLSPDGFVPRKRKSGSQQLDTVPVPSPHLTSSPLPQTGRGTSGLSPRLASLAAAGVPALSGATPVTAGGLDADDIARQLDQIEVELSLMLAQDKSLWDLAGLTKRVTQLVERGPDPVARGRARLVLDKIEQFATAFAVEQHGPLQTSTGTANPASEAAGRGNALADPRYDGQGWLKPVISRKGDPPPAPFALVDGEGKPLCFVTPSPGLNMNRYLNKQVGVYGRRGYIESLKTPHVTAERAIDLEPQWR